MYKVSLKLEFDASRGFLAKNFSIVTHPGLYYEFKYNRAITNVIEILT